MEPASPSGHTPSCRVDEYREPPESTTDAPAVPHEPIRIDDSSRRLRLPGFIQHLSTQYPPAGMFTVHELDWKFVGTGKQMGLVAAFPRQRLHDFRIGESHRGGCKVLIGSYKATTESVLQNDRGLCVYGAPSYAIGKKRQAESMAAAHNRDSTVARYGSTPDAQSKKNCAYCCYVRVYAKCANVVIVKFPCYEGDTPATCMTMKHCTPHGEPAHVGVQGHQHLRQWSPEATSLIISRLNLQMKPAVIIQDVKSAVLRWLNISPDCSPEETRQMIADSHFGKDFYVTNSRIQYLRRKYVDTSGACKFGTVATACTQDASSIAAVPTASPPPMDEEAPQSTGCTAEQFKQDVLSALAQAGLPDEAVHGMDADALWSGAISALDAVQHAEASTELGTRPGDVVLPCSGESQGLLSPAQDHHGAAGAGVSTSDAPAHELPGGPLVPVIDEGPATLSHAWTSLAPDEADETGGSRDLQHDGPHSKRGSLQAEADVQKRAKFSDPVDAELLQVLAHPRPGEEAPAQLLQAREPSAQHHYLQQLVQSLVAGQQREARSADELAVLMQQWRQQQQLSLLHQQYCQQRLQQNGDVQQGAVHQGRLQQGNVQQQDVQQLTVDQIQRHLLHLLANRPAG